jgi:hypothetical protein
MTISVLDSTGATQTVNTLPSLGQALAAASLPVVLASDQSTITVQGTITANVGSGTQPVSGTVTANAGTGTFAISAASLPLPTGAATSAKQPALGTAGVAATDVLTVQGIASMTALKVDGSAVTQPISASALPLPTGAATAANQTALNALLPTSLGTKTAANSLAVTLASDGALTTVAGATTDAAVANGAAGTLAGYLRSIKDAATDTTTPSPVSAPTITKGTQAANGFTVQPLRDAGRNTIALTAEFTFAQTAETLLTMTLSQNGGATTTFTSRTITSGKKFRITSMQMIVESLGSGTAPQRAYLRLRVNTAGATTTASPLQAILGVGVTTAIVKASEKGILEFPEGLEFNGDGTATFGFSLETPDWVTTTATGRAKITVIGYEY